jgi:hypothetical protein
MKINEYIAQHRMRQVDVHSRVRPGFVPSSLAAKFMKDDHVEYYSNLEKTRWVGICRARDFFAASNPGVAVTTGNLDQDYPTLRSF